MSFRGGGRGRGRGRGFGGRYCKPVPFVLFPDVELPDVKAVPEEKTLVIWDAKLQSYWKASPYYLEENVSKENQSIDIERYSDWGKSKNASKQISLDQILQLQSQNFPKELIGDPKKAHRSAKKMRWNLDADLARLDRFEKFEKEMEEIEGKEKKGDGEEDSDEEKGEQSDRSYSDDGDYNENEQFDDDDDDYNVEEGGGGDDELIY